MMDCSCACASPSAAQVHGTGNGHCDDSLAVRFHAVSWRDDRRRLCRRLACRMHRQCCVLSRIPARKMHDAVQPDAQPPHVAYTAFSAQSVPRPSAPVSRQAGESGRVRRSSKIKGSARDRLQRQVCTWGRAARGRCPVVPSWRASARRGTVLCVPSALHYAPALRSQCNGHTR